MRSAGLLLYRRRDHGTEVFLVHPGGPFWQKKDLGAWSIPKGMFEPGEEAPSGKVVEVWSVRGDCNPEMLRSQVITVEWPPRSGRRVEVPEVDRAAWFSFPEAERRILPGQRGFLSKLARALEKAPPR